MVHKSVWPGWSDAAPVRPSHAENESDHFYRAQVLKLSPSPTASEPIRAAEHARHSISAGLELIKLSISDNPLFLCCSSFNLSSLLCCSLSSFFLSASSLGFGSGNTDVDALVPMPTWSWVAGYQSWKLKNKSHSGRTPEFKHLTGSLSHTHIH